MATPMTDDEIDRFIAAESVARIGCHAGGRTYVVPVAYAVAGLVRPGHRDIKRAVVSLIAGISLLDALLIADAGDAGRAAWAALGFVLTLVFQRWVPGT